MTDRQKQFLVKAASYCAYQERSTKEVRQRLQEWELLDTEIDSIVEELTTQNYLNEERFARAFAGGKFRLKKWGRLKIRQELKLRGVSNEMIQRGMQEIDGDEYEQTLRELIDKKSKSLGTLTLDNKQKLVRFALSKGFERDIVWALINDKSEN